MDIRIKLKNYLHFGIQSSCLFLTVKYLMLALHELGHCLGGWIVGLKPIGLYLGFFGGGGSYIMGSGNLLQGLISTTAGPTLEFIFGIISFFLILPRVKRWGFRLFWLFASMITIFSFWVYMIIGGFIGYGDFAQIASILGIGRYFAGILGVMGLLGFAYLIGRRIFVIFSPYFILDTYWSRFSVIFLFIGIPGIMNTVGGYILFPIGGLNQLLLVTLIVIVISVLFSLFRQESTASTQDIPKLTSLLATVCLSIVILIWLGLFGPKYWQARGILWATPEEDRVRVCNIVISIKKDFSSRIDFLMRPYSQRMFWERIKHETPNWSEYDKFVDTYFPVLLGISEYEVTERINDISSPFYCKIDDYGARRISLNVDLDKNVQRIDNNTFVLEVTDFWRIRQGYLDKLKIILEEDMRFMDYELIPKEAKNPDFFNEQRIMWENGDASVPEKIRLIFSDLNNDE